MPKIKMKKRVGLEELLNLLSNDEIEQRKYRGSKGTHVYPDATFYDDFEIEGFKAKDTFEIEVEQEIDEHTKLKGLLEKYHYGDEYDECNVCFNWGLHDEVSINELLSYKNKNSETIAIYLLHDNHEIQLIWKYGEFVE